MKKIRFLIVAAFLVFPLAAPAQSTSRHAFEPTRDAACKKARAAAKADVDHHCSTRGGIHGLTGGRCTTQDASSLYEGKKMYKGVVRYQVVCKR